MKKLFLLLLAGCLWSLAADAQPVIEKQGSNATEIPPFLAEVYTGRTPGTGKAISYRTSLYDGQELCPTNRVAAHYRLCRVKEMGRES